MKDSIDVSEPGNVDAKADKTSLDPKEILSRASTTSLEEEPFMLDKEQAGKNEPESRIDISKPGQIKTLVAEGRKLARKEPTTKVLKTIHKGWKEREELTASGQKRKRNTEEEIKGINSGIKKPRSHELKQAQPQLKTMKFVQYFENLMQKPKFKNFKNFENLSQVPGKNARKSHPRFDDMGDKLGTKLTVLIGGEMLLKISPPMESELTYNENENENLKNLDNYSRDSDRAGNGTN